MTTRRLLAGVTASLIVSMALTACGGGGGDSTTTGTETGGGLSPAVVARANANCRELVTRTKELTKGVFLRYPNLLVATTEGIVRPGIPLMEREARKQRALAAAADDPTFDRYVALFDPLIVIGQQLLDSGRAQDLQRSKNLEGLLTGIGVEQRQAARDLGLSECQIDFPDLVLKSAEH